MPSIVNRDDTTGRSVASNLSGQRFGLLTVTHSTGEKDRNGYWMWEAICDCGKTIIRPSYRFSRGIQSCGCLPRGRKPLPNNQSHINLLYTKNRYSAKVRELMFSISPSDFQLLIEQPCHYCGSLPLLREHKNLAGKYANNGLDRKNNSEGYTVENCVSCCWTCNRMKNTLSAEEFISHIERVHDHITIMRTKGQD